MTSGEIYSNKAVSKTDSEATSGRGGGVYIGGGTVTIGGGKIFDNVAPNYGGGMYVGYGNVTYGDENGIGSPSICNNRTDKSGGGLYLSDGDFSMVGGSIGSESDNNANTTTDGPNQANGTEETEGHGGGIFVNDGTFTMSKGTIAYNMAAHDGGGFYVNDGGITLEGTNSADISIDHNNATCDGGGFYANGGDIIITNATIGGNSATQNGGGVFSNGGNTVIAGGTVQYNTAANGGGLFANGGAMSLSNGSILSNNASQSGGGLFVNGGSFTLSNGNIGDEGYANIAVNGGGVYVQGGTATIQGGFVKHNTATNGGGLFLQGINGDNLAKAYFSQGDFTGNTATNGGGIYLATNAELHMSLASNIQNNSVTNGNGGGVMINGGQFIIHGGDNATLKVNQNVAGTERNNVYLASNNDYITIVDGDIQGVNVGISVNPEAILEKGYEPVIHSTVTTPGGTLILNNIYNKLVQAYNGEGEDAIFDDARKHEPLYSSTAPFSAEFIYFVRTWKSVVNKNEFNTWLEDNKEQQTIDNEIDLGMFMVLANKVFCKIPDDVTLNGVVTSDLDMTDALWLPIGEYHELDDPAASADPFNGKFDGQGHTISGLNMIGLTNYKYLGMFGKTNKAEIKNVNLTDVNFVSGEAKRMGCLIGEMDGGTVANCVVGGTVDVSGSESQYNTDGVCEDDFYCVAGGLVGETIGTTSINNCILTAEVIATVKEDPIYVLSQKYTVGGLVGKTSDLTTIENGFANALIRHDGKTVTEYTIPETGKLYDDRTPIDRFVGGLVGYNEGTLTNCYVRLERGVEVTDKSLFGMFAGSNTGSIINCYAPDKTEFSHSYPYLYGNAMSGLSDYGDYGKTVCPYTYSSYNKDNKVTKVNGLAVSGKFLLDELNSMVTNSNGYSHWMRTSASPINGDYLVLSFDNLDGTLDYTTVGSKDGIQLEYGHSVNTMIERFNGYADGGSLYIYKTPGEMQTSRDGVPAFTGETITEANDANVNIYLQQDVALKNDVNLQNVNACVVLDNSDASGFAGGSYDWHMFSTPLTDVPLGINYSNYTPAGSVYGTPSEVSFNNPDGYFPTNTPYGKWDFYCYNEKHSTWINYKRATGDHYDTFTEEKISDFENEEKLILGKGYLAAADTDDEQGLFLQAKGTLNNADVNVAVTYSGHHVTGCNFIGNPYQAYLDFEEFFEDNKSNLASQSYAMIDADKKGYVYYTKECSKNEDQGSRYIHPHQGFIVKVNAAGTLNFKPDMAVVDQNSQTSPYREAHVDYPLVNLFASDSEGNREVATAELGRPENGGALKIEGMQMGKCTMSISNQGERYGIAFIEGNPEEVAVHFHATEDGDFTMKWNTYNGTFSYLHLIDNLTGMDIDCLSQSEYKFTASTGDYASRFKLKFEFTGVEENEAASAGSSSFAFFHQGSLVVNGQGNLELIDLSGRVLMTKNLGEGQSTVALPEVPEGLYLLRLADDSNVKTQKIIIK